MPDAGSITFGEKQRQTVRGVSDQQQPVRPFTVADECLGAGQPVLPVFECDTTAHAAQIRTGLGFGQRERNTALATQH
ncbi:hypothetical protein D9M69_546760 [compost metagenome]